MSIHDPILLTPSKNNDLSLADITKEKTPSPRRPYSPPRMMALDSSEPNSGSAYVQPENCGGVWGS